jgi:hypothetical protein
MRLNRYLTELLKTDIPIKIERETLSSLRATFVVNDVEYKFHAGDFDDGWHISFTAEKDLSTGKRFDSLKDREGITGKGDAIQVFSAIVKLFKLFIKQHRPYRFYFYAKEASRQKLYDRFAKLIGKGGYTFDKYVDPEWPSWGMKYDFRRKKRKKK